MEISEFIKKTRKTKQLSLQAMADALERYGYRVERQAISHWEHGRNNAPLHDVAFRRALAAVFDMDINDLMNTLGYVIQEDERSPESRLAADIVERLPENERQRAIVILQALEKSLPAHNGS